MGLKVVCPWCGVVQEADVKDNKQNIVRCDIDDHPGCDTEFIVVVKKRIWTESFRIDQKPSATGPVYEQS